MAKQKIKILIAEDDQFLSKVLGTILVDEGFEIDKAMNGEEAIEKVNQDGYKLILLDMIMPKMTGFEVLAHMKKAKMKTPVLVFSNLSQPEDKTEALKLGAKDYFVKSNMSVDEVIKEVKKYC